MMRFRLTGANGSLSLTFVIRVSVALATHSWQQPLLKLLWQLNMVNLKQFQSNRLLTVTLVISVAMVAGQLMCIVIGSKTPQLQQMPTLTLTVVTKSA